MGKFNLNQILNDASKRAAPGGGGQTAPASRPATIERLSVFDLVPSEDNFYSMNDIEELKSKIELSKPVENMVANVPDYVRKKIAGKQRRNKRLEEVGAAIGRELDRLNYYEKAVVTWFYLDGATWEQISGRLNYSPRQCRNIRDKALDRLTSWFSANKAIFTFKFPEK